MLFLVKGLLLLTPILQYFAILTRSQKLTKILEKNNKYLDIKHLEPFYEPVLLLILDYGIPTVHSDLWHLAVLVEGDYFQTPVFHSEKSDFKDYSFSKTKKITYVYNEHLGGL